MEATDPQQSYQTMGYVVAGSWGAGLPSFWCVQLPQRAHRQNERQFLVREEHAAQFAIEFPPHPPCSIPASMCLHNSHKLFTRLLPREGFYRRHRCRRCHHLAFALLALPN